MIYPTNYHYDQVNQVLNKYSTRVMRLATSNQQPATILTLVMKSHSDKGAFGRNRLISLVAGHAGRKKQGTISLSANSWSQLNCGHHLREAEHNSARWRIRLTREMKQFDKCEWIRFTMGKKQFPNTKLYDISIYCDGHNRCICDLWDTPVTLLSSCYSKNIIEIHSFPET